MNELNENALKLRAYAGADNAPVKLDKYGHDLSVHDDIRTKRIADLLSVFNYIYKNTKPVAIRVPTLKKIINFLTRAERTESKYPYVHEASEAILAHLRVIANPSQQAQVRGVAALEFMHAYKNLLEHPEGCTFLSLHCETYGGLQGCVSTDMFSHLRELWLELTVCFERTPGYLLIPAKELHMYGLMLPTGVLIPRSNGPEFLSAYDRHKTLLKRVNTFKEDIRHIQGYLKSRSDPYLWFTWSTVCTKGDSIAGIWPGALIVEILKKSCIPEQVATGVLASRVALDYLAATGQIADITGYIEECAIPDGLLRSLTELREEQGTSRWGDYNQQGARHLNRVANSVNVSSVALKLPAGFILESRTCAISPSTVNSVADYVNEHVSYENEIVLQTLLRDGWSGSFEELVIAANAL